jgi:hypothetical protein
MGFCVETLWALKRWDSSMAGGSEGAPEVEELGVWAPLLVEDDVLFEESSLKPHLAGQEKGG